MSTVTTEKTGAAGPASWIPRLQHFLQDVRVEMRKVSWPTLDEVRQATIAVSITSFVLAVFIFMIDHLLSRIIKFVL